MDLWVPFLPYPDEQIEEAAVRYLRKEVLSHYLQDEKRIAVGWDHTVVSFLMGKFGGDEGTAGFRPMHNAIVEIHDLLCGAWERGEIQQGDGVLLMVTDGKIDVVRVPELLIDRESNISVLVREVLEQESNSSLVEHGGDSGSGGMIGELQGGQATVGNLGSRSEMNVEATAVDIWGGVAGEAETGVESSGGRLVQWERQHSVEGELAVQRPALEEALLEYQRQLAVVTAHKDEIISQRDAQIAAQVQQITLLIASNVFMTRVAIVASVIAACSMVSASFLAVAMIKVTIASAMSLMWFLVPVVVALSMLCYYYSEVLWWLISKFWALALFLGHQFWLFAQENPLAAGMLVLLVLAYFWALWRWANKR